MAIRQISGADTQLALLEARAVAGTVSINTATKRTGSASWRVNPATTGAGSIEFGTWGANGLAQGGLNEDPVGLAFYFRPDTLPAANSEEIAVILDTGGTNGFFLRIRSDGKLELYQNGTTFVATGTAVLSVGNWYRIDFYCDHTADTQTVKVANASDIAGTATSATNFGLVFLGKRTNRNGQSVDFYYDDIAIADDPTVSLPQTGDYDVRLALPNAAGAASGWTNGPGTDTFAEVDEVPPDDDTTYLGASSTQDNQDHTLQLQSLADIGASTTIYAVQSMVRARTDSTGGASTVAVRTVVDGIGFELTALELLTTYQNFARCDDIDYENGVAWTQSVFDAHEVGMAANTLAQAQRFTFCASYVMTASGSTVSVAAVAATATAAVPAPTITSVSIRSVTGVPAEATAAVPAPTIEAQDDVTVAGVAAAADAAVPAPTITAVHNVTVTVPAAAADAAVPLPTIEAQDDVLVTAVPAAADAAVPTPTVTNAAAGNSVTVDAPAAGADAAVPAPTVTAQAIVSVAAPAAAATAEVPAPTITTFMPNVEGRPWGRGGYVVVTTPQQEQAQQPIRLPREHTVRSAVTIELTIEIAGHVQRVPATVHMLAASEISPRPAVLVGRVKRIAMHQAEEEELLLGMLE